MFETWLGRRVLVTGGLGFIGSNLVLELVSHGAQVTVIDRTGGQYGGDLRNVDSVAHQIVLRDADIRDSQALAECVPEHEIIFCLAGQVSHSNSMTDPLTDLDINCRASLQLLEICRQSNPDARLIFTSTRQVYGRPQTCPVDEHHPLCPVDVNGISKVAAEHLLRLYWEVHGIRSISLRLTNTYGPRMDLKSPGRGFINVCLGQALRGDVVSLFDSGDQQRDFTFVADVVQALMLAARQQSGWGAAYNLSHPEPCSLRKFVSVLSQFIDVRVEQVPFPPDRRAIEVGDYWGNSNRFRQLTGWVAKTGLEEGLRETVQFFLQHHHSNRLAIC
jgi:nucleoside-diphosphate-sugar epimerase